MVTEVSNSQNNNDEELVGKTRVEDYFRNLSPEEIQELDEFIDFIKMNSLTEAELLDEVESNPHSFFYCLGLNRSSAFNTLRKRPNILTWRDKYKELYTSKEFERHLTQNNLMGLDTHEKFTELVISKGKKIIMIVPPKLLTYFAGKVDDEELATIKEFNYLMRNLHRLTADQLLIVME